MPSIHVRPEGHGLQQTAGGRCLDASNGVANGAYPRMIARLDEAVEAATSFDAGCTCKVALTGLPLGSSKTTVDRSGA